MTELHCVLYYFETSVNVALKVTALGFRSRKWVCLPLAFPPISQNRAECTPGQENDRYKHARHLLHKPWLAEKGVCLACQIWG